MKKFLILIVVLLLLVGCGSEEKPVVQEPEVRSVVEPAPAPAVEEVKPVDSGETLSQKNAVGMAELYIETMPFSKSGLVEQLEFEGFNNEDATYAVDKINVDWMEQAALKGKQYLDTMSFSRTGLIEQLEFEGFSSDEATYAVDQIGF